MSKFGIKITRDKGDFQIDVKRLYLPFTVKQPCPKCGHVCVRNLKNESLSYPWVGQPVNLYGYCDECDHEWKMEVIFDVLLTEVGGTPTLTDREIRLARLVRDVYGGAEWNHSDTRAILSEIIGEGGMNAILPSPPKPKVTVQTTLRFTKNEPGDPIVYVYRKVSHGWDGIGWVEKHGTGCWSATPGVGKATAHGFKTRRDAGVYLDTQTNTEEVTP